MITAVGEICLVCHEQIIVDPAWTWFGDAYQIWAHIGCAGDLNLRIGHDILLWQKKSGKRFHDFDRDDCR